MAKTGAAKGENSEGEGTINRFRLLNIQVASSHCATRIPMGRISRGVEESGTKDGARNLSAYLDMRRNVIGLDFLIPRTPPKDTLPLQAAI
jgi:hypothetical protein